MRNLIFLCALALGAQSKSQRVSPTPTDSIPYFAYMVMRFGEIKDSATGKTGIGVAQYGTCFFIKWNTALYLVSAKHVLTPCHNLYNDNREPSFPDALYVRIKERDRSYRMYKINTKAIADTVPCLGYMNEPDVFIIRVKDLEDEQINSIERYLMPNIADSIIERYVYGTGYPGIQYVGNQTPVNTPARVFKAKIEFPIHAVISFGDTVDPYVISSIVDSGIVLSGSSGSPVFMKSKGTGNLLFGGILSRSIEGGRTYFIKPDEVLLKLNERLKEDKFLY
jgi:hypothetical protein